MLETRSNTTITEAIFSKDGNHHYALKKIIDEDKPTVTILTMFPHYDGVITLDLTTQLCINSLTKLGYGTIHFVNIFSNIKSPDNKRHLENGYDKHTDIQIMKCIKESDELIIAWGAYAERPTILPRVQEIEKMIKPYVKKTKRLINPINGNIIHPLNPIARQKWELK